MSNRDRVLSKLFSRTTQGIRFGLERILKAAQYLGNPQNAFQSIHVAGTNGKGSVCAFLDSILRLKGYAAGLYASPHIVKFEERFMINGTTVDTDEWLDIYIAIEDVADRHSLTFFEIATLIAFELFRRRKVEWAVIETGLGGRLDATNIITPCASVITSIGIEHTEYLGSDIISIAREKLGIIKKNVPVIIADHENPDVLACAQMAAQEQNADCIIADENEASDVKAIDAGTGFLYKGRRFLTPLTGRYQVMNTLCAVKAAERLGLADLPALADGVAKTSIPGRFQIQKIPGKTIIFDVAHNPQATRELCKTIRQRFPGSPVCIVAGIMADKDSQSMFREYAECADTIIITCPKTERAASTAYLLSMISKNYDKPVRAIENVKEAMDHAIAEFEGVICVTGSFFTVGEAMVGLGIKPYA